MDSDCRETNIKEGKAMTVGEFCIRNVIITERETTITEVAKLMRKFHVGDVVVIERRGDSVRPVGIITDRDIVANLVAKGVDLDTATAGEVMSTKLIMAQESEGIWVTLQRMRQKGIRRIPVINEDGGLEGILAVDDVLELLAEELTLLSQVVDQEQEREKKTL